MKAVARALAALAGAAAMLATMRVDADPPENLGPEILHLPLLERKAEQGILRPVPIAVDLPEDMGLRARRVLLHYHLWGDPDWTTLELRRRGARFEGAVPCLEVSTVTGDLRYYIRVHDAEGNVVASAGSIAKPYIVVIKHDTTLAEGTRQTAKCPDPADCPRGLPGCPSERVIDVPCRSDADCNQGMTCGFRSVCEHVTRRKTWVSLAVEQGFGLIARDDACGLWAQEHEGFACFRKDGKQYVGNPVHVGEPPGAAAAPTRVVIGVDRLVAEELTVGVRVGVTVRGEGPTPRDGTAYVPISAAARVTYWFGADPFARPRIRPFAFLTAGYGMTDLRTTTDVREDPTKTYYQGGNDLEQRLVLWKRAGDGFAGAGAGITIPLGTRAAAFAELSALGVFPFGALLVTPSAGVMMGF
ncbi:hypothetical protein A7982_12842 [Minicystis rosea]|nr:hypothetical protein A7982_12842 [Minicystis rosea]